MSRKLNRMRNRLRITNEQHAKREKRLRQEELALRNMKSDLVWEEQRIKEKSALNIVVEDVPSRFRENAAQYCCQVYFCPDIILFRAMRDPIAELSNEAYRTAHEVAHRVYQALIQRITEKSGLNVGARR